MEPHFEIMRHIINETFEEKRRLELLVNDLHRSAIKICDRYVSPDMYRAARAEIDNVFSSYELQSLDNPQIEEVSL